MTIGEFKQVLKEHDIPEDTLMLSDSGWECGPTDMDGIYYNESEKELVFTQRGDKYDDYYEEEPGWKLIHSDEEKDE